MKHTMEHEITPVFLLRFTLPSIIMMVVLSLYTVADGVLVSHFVGTEAFSAINVVYPLHEHCCRIGHHVRNRYNGNRVPQAGRGRPEGRK